MNQKQYSPKDLELPDDEPMVIIRSSFLWICDGDKYAAAALNMYVHWTRWLMKHRPVAQQVNRLLKKQGKTPSQDTSLILYRKQAALVKDLLGFCSEKRLRQANDLLISKGLLKIDDTPRSLSDHVLKYELQIDVFKELMQQWKDQRKTDDEFDDEMVEVSLEDDSDGTDNLPSRSGTFTASSSVRNGKFTDRSGKNAVSNNRYNQRDDSRDNQEREKEPALITSSILSSDQQIFFHEIYCQSKIGRVPPERIDETLKKYIIRLMQHINTVKKLDSLYDFVQKKIEENNKIIDKTVYPGNLANAKNLDGWLQAQERIEQNPPEPEIIEACEPANRENEPLPRYLCQWMIRTEEEFGEEGTGWVNELEWYYQHTSCPEGDFYTLLLQAYQEVHNYQEGQRMKELLIEFDQLLSLETPVLS